MQTEALIIFVRNPVLGRVKTRLAQAIGEAGALEVYRRLLRHTESVTRDLRMDKYVFYSENIEENDGWDPVLYAKERQRGEELGERMRSAFEALFRRGYRKVLIIGSDCFELTRRIIEDGFKRLDEQDLVLGPSVDGGYYLAGMKKLTGALFDRMPWSTPAVLGETLHRALEAGMRYSLLPLLPDVDEEKDIPGDWIEKIKI